MPSYEFNVEVRPARERLVLAVSGEVDLATVPVVDAAIADAVATGWDDIVVDLRMVSFMDSSGVWLLAKLRDTAGDRVSYSMIDGTPPVSRVLELAGVTDVLPRADPAEL